MSGEMKLPSIVVVEGEASGTGVLPAITELYTHDVPSSTCWVASVGVPFAQTEQLTSVTSCNAAAVEQ